MTNMVIQQFNIADYKNIFVMPITSNYRLIIINGPSDKWESSGFRTEGHVWPKLEAKLTECPLWIFDIWSCICSGTKYAIMKKLKGTRFFLGLLKFWKKLTFLFLIVVEKSPNKSYRAMQYLQNELLTSILCQIEPDLQAFEIRVWPKKNITFSFFHTPISRNSPDLDKKNLVYLTF